MSNESIPQPKPLILNKRFQLISVLTLLAVLIFGAYVSRSSVYEMLDTLNLIPRSEHFTELYFDNSLSLPHTVRAGKTVSFSFVIHNLEGKEMSYPYRVYYITENGTTTIESAIRIALDGGYATTTETFTAPPNITTATVFVSLPKQQQDIHFTISKSK